MKSRDVRHSSFSITSNTGHARVDDKVLNWATPEIKCICFHLHQYQPGCGCLTTEETRNIASAPAQQSKVKRAELQHSLWDRLKTRGSISTLPRADVQREETCTPSSMPLLLHHASWQGMMCHTGTPLELKRPRERSILILETVKEEPLLVEVLPVNSISMGVST